MRVRSDATDADPHILGKRYENISLLFFYLDKVKVIGIYVAVICPETSQKSPAK